MRAGLAAGRGLLGAAASGVLMAAAFPRWELDFLAWICLIPFFLAVREAGTGRSFASGVIMGGVFFAFTVYWVAETIHRYGQFPLWAGIGALLLLVIVLSIYFGLVGALIARIRPIPVSFRPFATAAVWVSVEFLRAKLFTGFPWALLGYSQVHRLPMIQVADMTSVYGVSFVIVVVNAALAECIAGLRERPRRIAWTVGAGALGLVVLTAAYGAWRLGQFSAEHAPTMTVSLVQGNIEQDKKWDERYQDETMSAYERLTARVAPDRPDLVVWPEAATPYFFLVEKPQTERLLKMITRDKLTLLFGAPAVADVRSNDLLFQNSAYIIGPDGAVLGRYNKMHLVPFGEYVPFRKALFFIHKLVDFVGDFTPGRHPVVISTAAGRVGIVICFEAVFPDLVRQFVLNGADLMTTITNDAWFGTTAAPYEHFNMAVFRSVENRVSLVRVANTGISGYVEPTGRVHDTTPLFEEATRTSRVALRTRLSVYTRFGDVFAVGCVIITAVIVIASPRRKP